MKFFCVSGYHNVGKTSFILKFLEFLKKKKETFAVIKSTHHKNILSSDITKDTSKFSQMGADTALITPEEIFIEKRKNVIKKFSETQGIRYIIFKYFFSYDWVILEGFKNTELPKLEVIKDVSDINFNLVNRLAFVINENLANEEKQKELLEKLEQYFPKTPVFFFKDVEKIYEFLKEKLESYRLKIFIDLKEIKLKPFVENLFYNLLTTFLDSLKDTQGKSVEIFFEKRSNNDSQR